MTTCPNDMAVRAPTPGVPHTRMTLCDLRPTCGATVHIIPFLVTIFRMRGVSERPAFKAPKCSEAVIYVDFPFLVGYNLHCKLPLNGVKPTSRSPNLY